MTEIKGDDRQLPLMQLLFKCGSLEGDAYYMHVCIRSCMLPLSVQHCLL